MFNILSCLGSTPPSFIFADLSTNVCINSSSSGDAGLSTIVYSLFFNFGTGNFNISGVCISATCLNIFISSGILLNLLNLSFNLYPLPSGAISKLDTTSPKVVAQSSKLESPISFNVSGCKYLCIVYNSDIEFETGVPVAKQTPLPLFFSNRYCIFIYISDAF